MKRYSFCNNCGKNGHSYQNCKLPIISNGIIAFKYNEQQLEYLMICRKDSLGYVDFLRGHYPLHNKEYLMNIINEMTINEKEKLKRANFDELWNELWGEYLGIQYGGEGKVSKEKFRALKSGITINNKQINLEDLIEESTTCWEQPEWGFPKGRRNYQEKDLMCALREFEEETGYKKNTIKIISNVIPYEEIFIGSNFKSYKHRYFLAYMENNIKPFGKFQLSEVSEMKWSTFEDCMKHIRPYNLEKKDILEKVNTVLQEYRLYS